MLSYFFCFVTIKHLYFFHQSIKEPLHNSGEAVAVGAGWEAKRLFRANSTAVRKKNNAADRPSPADHRPRGIMQRILKGDRHSCTCTYKRIKQESNQRSLMVGTIRQASVADAQPEPRLDAPTTPATRLRAGLTHVAQAP